MSTKAWIIIGSLVVLLVLVVILYLSYAKGTGKVITSTTQGGTSTTIQQGGLFGWIKDVLPANFGQNLSLT